MQSLWQKIAEILLLTRLKKRWQKIARALAIIVVFCTTYMLILPAITLENKPYCGFEEHTHEAECYSDNRVIICGKTEHRHEEYCFISELATNGNITAAMNKMTDGNITEGKVTDGNIVTEKNEDNKLLSFMTSLLKAAETEQNDTEDETATNILAVNEEENTISLLADAQNPITKVNFDSLDGSGNTYYVVYTLYNGTYYAVPGTSGGKPLAITVNSDGSIEKGSLNNNYYWNFNLQSGSSYYIQNLGTSRYMHSYNNSSTDYGITTSGKYTSSLEAVGSGSNKTFRVKSNNNYSAVTGSGTNVTFNTTTASGSAAQYYIAEVYIPQDVYHVWFDGTCGGLMSLYESPNTYLGVPGDNNTIILPAQWDSPSKYSYVLNGWYDIKNNVYYKPGAQVTITKNTVFYADWVAKTYDVGIVNDENMGLIAPSLDTNTFIRTDMFDYSAVFNMQAVTHSGNVSASSHSETWSVVQNANVPYNNVPSLGFTFRDWDSGGVNISYAGNRARLNDNIGTEITSGIVDYVYNMSGKDIIDILFNPETDIIGKNHVGQANYLYQFMEEGSENYDGEHNGYYYYDSRYNAASYNQTNERFYIYDYLERTSDSLKDGCDSNGNKTSEGGYSDFLPFNSPYVNNHNNKTIVRYADGDGVEDNYQYDAKATNQSSNIANVGTNYWFGMKSEIQFYLPDDTGTVDAYNNYGNISSHGQHMTFEFSGDDDLWVFIDGEPVMDIGGLHGIMEGKIDFSTGIITTSKAAGISAGSSAGSGVAVTDSLNLEAGDHTLTVYYMERGGSQSNCAIYFNITPRYGLELTKLDSINDTGLDGAVFGVYTDIACTDPALLWNSESAHRNGEESTSIFTAVNGKISFWGISAGKVYYLKELVAPSGYPLTDDIIRISMNALGNSICSADALRGEDGLHTDGFDIINNSANEAQQQLSITLTNQQYTTNKRNVAVTKHWAVEDESNIPESVTVYLRADGHDTGRYAVLSKENNWSYLWIDLPIYNSIGEKIEYSIYEEQTEDFFTNIEAEENQVINAWVQTDSLYDGGTFLIVNSDGLALTVNSAGNFAWISKETAENDPSAQWIVNADGMGFHVIDKSGYHIILDGTNEFLPDKDGNRILYYDNFGLAARHSNTYYYLNDNFSADTQNNLHLELYINMDILVHEEDEFESDDGEHNPEEDDEKDNKVLVTMYNVTNTYIEEDKKTSFEVEKLWEDNSTNHINDSITVCLFANGVDTGRKIVLNNSNGWKNSFSGLLYEDNDGNKINYTVVEESFKNYYPEYSQITEVEGQTITEWLESNSLEEGKVYMFTNGNYALSCNSNNAVTSSVINESNEYQQWRVISYNGNLKLQNVGTGRYLYYNRSLTTNTSYTNNYANVSLTSNRLRIGNTTNRYITLGTSVSTTTSSGSATTLTVKVQNTYYANETYKITVKNIKAQYILPETGGTGTEHVYIIGGLLIILSSAFLLCLYIKHRGRRRSDFG